MVDRRERVRRAEESGDTHWPMQIPVPPPPAPPPPPRQPTVFSEMPEHCHALAPVLPAERHRLEVPQDVLSASNVPGDVHQHNPTLLVRGDRLLCIVRTLAVRPKQVSTTYNFLGWIGDDWTLREPRRVHDHAAGDRQFCPNYPWEGYEDCRLFEHRGQLWASCSVADRGLHPHIAIIRFDEAGDVREAYPQPSSRMEKNWMPVLGTDPPTLVYSTQPIVLVDFHGERVVPRDRFAHEYAAGLKALDVRGSSQLIPWEDGYLAVGHKRDSVMFAPDHGGTYRERRRGRKAGSAVIYFHYFLRFNRELTHVQVSRPFYVHRPGVEFACGLAHWKGKLVMSYGVVDQEAWLAVVEPDVMRGTF